MKQLIAILFTLLFTSIGLAHEGHSHAPTPENKKKIERLNTEQKVMFVATQLPASQQDLKRPEVAKHFGPFDDKVKVRWDKEFLYVESNGMPDHPMMIGITAWQQQVPLPQSYTGSNAWRIPLHPVPAKNPMSAKEHFFRGAIALAVNGIPIFNPIKNDGKTDTLLAGELDQWGGHCGRADDYHYHLAPVHLEKLVGKGNPVGVALDGYPIYGYVDADGKSPVNLDWLNGHKDSNGNYHYHATKTYPYLNGGFYGEVVERDGQVDPQPRAQPIRPVGRPLRGAKITGFANPQANSYKVEYDVFGDKRYIQYNIVADGSAEFRYVWENGTRTETETYAPQRTLRGSNPATGSRQAGRAASPSGSHSGDGPRQPWIVVHADEIDLDKDKIISRDEIVGEATKAFAGYDANGDGKLSESELSGRGGSRSAMGGFLKGHSHEIDRDGDGILTRTEAVGNAERMFAKMDLNGDGKITSEEMEASRRK